MDKPVAAPRMKKIPPTPLPRTEITETARAFQGFTKSYQVGIKNDKDPLVQLNTTRLAIAHFMKQLLPRMKEFKFIETLTIYFEQKKGNEIVSRIGYFNSKPKTIINADDLAPFLDFGNHGRYSQMDQSRFSLVNQINQWSFYQYHPI